MSNYSKEDIRARTLASERKYGLPEDTLYKIMGIESGHRAGAVSPKGAQGWMQFIPSTAKAYGLQDPHNLDQAVEAGGKYMKDLLGQYGGNMDHALAHYNGGGRAVAALKSGKPWAETDDYLTKFNKGSKPTGAATPPAPVAPAEVTKLGSQFTALQTVPSTDGPSASALARSNRQHENEYGGVVNFFGNLGRGAVLGFETQNTARNFYLTQGIQDLGADIDWKSKEAKEVLNQYPKDHWGYLTEAGTEGALAGRRRRLDEAMAQEKELANHGFVGAMAGGVLGSIPDVTTAIAMLPGMGGAGLMSKVSRLSNLARMSALGAAGNVATEVASAPYRPTATADDVWIAGLMGAGIGGLAGGAVNPRSLARENGAFRRWALREGNEAMEKEAKDAGLPVGRPADPPAEAPLPPHAPEGPQRPPVVEAPGSPEAPSGPAHQPTLEAPGGPTKAPEAPGVPEAPAGPREAPTGSPERPLPPGEVPPKEVVPDPPKKARWSEEWDTPRFTGGAHRILELPPVKKLADMVAYITEKSVNKDLVRIMQQALSSLDMRKIAFEVIDPAVAKNLRPGTGKLAPVMYAKIDGAGGLALTVPTEVGADVQVAIRGRRGAAEHGMTEEVLIHELVHAATVHKWNRAAGEYTKKGLTQYGRGTMSPASLKAYDELGALYKEVKALADKQGDLTHARVFLENAKEFISYGLTNRAFQKWLREQDASGTATGGRWARFTNAVRDFLGLAKDDTNALARLVNLSGDLFAPAGMERNRPSSRTVLQPTHDFIDAATVQAADDAGLSPVFGWGLGLEHKLGSEKIPVAVREVAAKLFGTTVGYKNHAVVKENVWDGLTMRSGAWSNQAKKAIYPAFDEWRGEQSYKWWQKGQAFEDFNEQIGNYVRGMEGDYHPSVIQAGNQVRTLMSDVVDHINNPGLKHGRVKRGLTEMEVFDDTTGETLLIGKLDKNPKYLPRKHDVVKWQAAIQNHGREAVEQWWAGAYKAMRNEVTDEDAARWAGWYVRAVEEARMNRGAADHLAEMMTGYDERALKESLVRNGGYTADEAERVVRGMFSDPSKDAGRTSSSLRHRNAIHEGFTMDIIDKEGKPAKLGLNDFIDTNVSDVLDSYFRRMASSIELADKMDVYRQADIQRIIDKATDRELGSAVSESVMVQAKKDLKFTFDRVQGIPQEDTTVFTKSMDMWGKFNVIRLMGGAVWNQAAEMGQIIGTMGWRATLSAIPELRAIRRDLRTGQVKNSLLEHLENSIGGVGSEYMARQPMSPKHDWVALSGGAAETQQRARRLDAVDNGLTKMAAGVLDYTGMTGLMVQQKRVHAIALVNTMVDHATGRRAWTKATKERLAWMGMSEDDFARLNAGIKKYTNGTTKGEYSTKAGFDFKAFARDEPELDAMFMNAVHRESRRVVQENDLASSIDWMGGTVGKAVFQFMNFVMHAWNKQMLFSMNHRDFSTLSSMLHGGFFASLAYMGRTQMSATGMDDEKREEFLAKRMSTKQIVANSFGRMAQASLLPQLYDSTMGNVTGTLFSGMRTTSDLSSIASNPTMQAVQGLLSTGKILHNALSDEQQTTAKDIKAWGRLLPLNNVMPMSTLLNAVAADYPTTEKE